MAKSRSAFIWILRAREIEGLAPSEKSVLNALASRADSNGFCFPGYQRLAHDTCYCKKTIQRAVASLEKKKLIRRQQRNQSNGNKGGCDYALTLPIGLGEGRKIREGGHPVPTDGDPESAQNYQYRTTMKQDGHPARQFEDRLIAALGDRFQPLRFRETLSVFEITRHLEELDKLKRQSKEAALLEQCEQLAADLRRSNRHLESWTALWIRISDSTNEPSDTRLEETAPTEAEKGRVYLKLFGMVQRSGHTREMAERELQDVTVIETSTTIQITDDVGCACQRLRERWSQKLRWLADEEDCDIELFSKGRLIDSIKCRHRRHGGTA
ncbi:MAG: helix-turn-helix domain-containing protein [Pseudomonadota bacterium]